TRKLRCTKLSAGCLRCTAEGLDCVYPLRRTMGRPKSHAPSETSNPQKPAELQAGPALHIMRFASPSLLGAMPTTSELDGRQALTNCQTNQQHSWAEFRFGVGVVDLLKSINFGGQDSLQQGLLPDILPNTSSPKDTRVKNTTSSVAPFCCTQRLLSCVDSLSMMPNDFWGALRTARRSSRTVYGVLKCLQCGTASARIPSPIIVVLGTVLFPLISDAYDKVAELVNKEAMHGQGQIIFDLESFGGLWGPLGENSMKCQEYYTNLALDAESWRTTVRALLRADIHGFDVQRRNDEGGTYLYHQPGLCDLIADIKDVLDRPNTQHGQ
ncbi:hypothetical protein B0T25DRAFT_431358, partial [Lasiosphaeria hispida]